MNAEPSDWNIFLTIPCPDFVKWVFESINNDSDFSNWNCQSNKVAITMLFHKTSETSPPAGHHPPPPTITNRTMSHIPLLPSISTFELCKSLFCTVQSCITLNIRRISFLCPLTLLHPFRCGILCRNPCCTIHSNATKNGITLDANNNWKLHCKYFFHCIDRNQIVSSDGRVGGGPWRRKLQFLQFKMCVLVENFCFRMWKY